MFWSVAYAQTAGAAQQPSTLEMFVPFVILLVFMYFIVLRPQAKKQKEHQKFVTELKRGDEVITTSGILGSIEGLTDTFITLQIAEGVRVKILRSQIMSSQARAAATAEGKK